MVQQYTRHKEANVTTYGDWFTGFGGAALGAEAAGLNVIFGAEYMPKIAAVSQANFRHEVKVCDLTSVDVTGFPYVDIFHASPPCQSFSMANSDGVKEKGAEPKTNNAGAEDAGSGPGAD